MKVASRVWFLMALAAAMASGLGFTGCNPTTSNGQGESAAKVADRRDSAKNETQTGSGQPPQPKDLTINQVLFSPDGKLLLAVDFESSFHTYDNFYLYDVEKRKELYHGRLKGIRTAEFFPDGKRIAFGCQSGSLVVWDVEKQKVNYSKSTKIPYDITKLLISADQRTIVTLSCLSRIWKNAPFGLA